MIIEEKLQEIFYLFKYFQFKGAPINGHPRGPELIGLIEEVLLKYGLPMEHDYERIFLEMNYHSEWSVEVCQEAIDNLERSQSEYKAGQTQFKSILVYPKTKLEERCVYISTELYPKYLNFLNNIFNVLISNGIAPQYIFGTEDVWCRDFMPVPVSKDKFVQFIYDPDYLKGKWSHLKTDPWEVNEGLDYSPIRSELVIDGGNVIRCGKTVIMTEKIFAENPKWTKPDLLKQISNEIEVEKVVLIPIEPEDYTGHADGMVRFVGEDAVIINDYQSMDGYTKGFITALRKSLESNGITIAGTLPYRSFPRRNKDGDYTAIGCYMNYLEMGNFILFPKFEIEEDTAAFEAIQKYFPLKKIVQLDCREIAEDGGVLNCITWNI